MRGIGLTAWLIASVGLCSTVSAQLSAAQARELNQVYVRDSSIALEKFALAERMQGLREWHKAADVYQEVLANYADRVVPSQTNSNGQIIQYTSVVTSVQQQLARWPAEGLAAYRARYDVEAQALLDSAKPSDLSILHKVHSTYFVTDAGRVAGVRLVDAQLEAGEFAAAAWTAQRILDLHPDVTAAASPHRPMLLYRAALAFHLAGENKQATARLDELKKSFPDALGRVRGQDARLAELLEAELSAPPPTASASSSDSWPMPFGSPDRARVPHTVNSIGANLYSIELSRAEAANPRLGISPQDGQSDSDRRNGLMTGVLPVIDRGELFFQDNSRVYAVNLESGLPLPGWAQTYDGNRGGKYVAAGAIPTPRGQLCTVSVTDNSVLAIMRMNDVRLMLGQAGRRDSRLVCLDRRTGVERWTARPSQIAETASPAVAAAMRELDFSGSPLVVGDNVYVMGRGTKGMQFEDCYVFCIDLSTGKSKWATYVASANIAGLFFDDSMGSSQQSVSHLAYASGRVFCLTNLGAMAAINAYDGTMAWLNVYPREEQDVNARFMPMRNAGGTRKPWSFNPVIVADQHVFVLPGDGKNLHVYDAGSGKELRSFGTLLRQDQNKSGDAQSLVREQINTIVGVVPSSSDLVIASDRTVLRVDWQTFEPMSEKGVGIKWTKIFGLPPFANTREPQLGRDNTAVPTIRGRPFLTAESVFVPTIWQLQTISLRTGSLIPAYPADRAWNDEEEPGNILATPEYLIIAGPNRVTVYTDLQMALKRLDAAIDAAPNDPDPRLRYAEVMFVSRKLDVALAKLDEAIGLLGGPKSMAPGPNRERVFADALTFAQKLSRPPLQADQATTINSLFDRALDAAQTPAQQLNLRLSQADYAALAQDPATELRMYQEILAAPEMRSITVARAESGVARQAALIARQGVTDILSRSGGRALYEPYEKEAAAALEESRLGADPARLLEIAQVYPNSTASRSASLLAAESFESSGNGRQAVQALRQLYFRVPSDAPERLRIIEALARNYLSMPNHLDVAAARLAQAAKLANNATAKLTRPMRLPDGQLLEDMTFAQALDAVRKIQSRAADRALPDLHLPTSATANIASFKPSNASPVILGVSALCVPLRDFTRTDRIVAYAPADGVAVYAVGADKPIFTSNALSEGPRNVAWTGGNLLAWDRSTIVMLDGDSGKTVWQMSLSTLPAAETLANAAGEAGDLAVANDIPANGVDGVMDANVNARMVQRRGDVQIIVGGQQRRFRGAVRRGFPLPAQAVAAPVNAGPEQIVGVQPLSDRVVFATTDGRVVTVDLAEGKLLWQSRTMKARIDKLVANDDFIAVKLSDASFCYLVALETAQGQPVFRWKLNAQDVNGIPSLLNLALASDGTLVWVMPDRVAGKDLFEPGDVLRFGDAPLAGPGVGAPPLLSAGGNDQFVVADGRILAIADSGSNVWVMSLDQGVMLRGTDGAEMRLSTRSPPGEGEPQMQVVGSMLHIASQSKARITTYDLNQPGWFWDGALDGLELKQVLIAREHLVVVTEKVPKKTGAVRLIAYSRRPEFGGRVESYYDFNEPVGILSAQAVEGGIYYLSGDQRLHFLAGAGSNK